MQHVETFGELRGWAGQVGLPQAVRPSGETVGPEPVAAIRTFDPRVLLGDRLGITLYTLVAQAILTGKPTPALGWYERFVGHAGEQGEHSLETFAAVVARIQAEGFDPAYPIYANPKEFGLKNGSHRCAAAIALGVTSVPYHLRFADDRTPTEAFARVFSPAELAQLEVAQNELIGQCPSDLAFIGRLRQHMRRHDGSFKAPFSSKTRLPVLRTYQSSQRLGVRGKRRTEERFAAYGLGEFLCRHMSVLEIGCNCGFLTLEIARRAGRVTAFDLDPNYVEIGKMAQRHFGLHNVEFFAAGVEQFRPTERYDCIVSCAVHGWIRMDYGSYVEHLRSMLNPGGLLVFESHELDCHPEWRDQKRHLLQHFDLLRCGWIDDVDEDVYESELREFLILKAK